jgi:hypothetical protein
MRSLRLPARRALAHSFVAGMGVLAFLACSPNSGVSTGDGGTSASGAVGGADSVGGGTNGGAAGAAASAGSSAATAGTDPGSGGSSGAAGAGASSGDGAGATAGDGAGGSAAGTTGAGGASGSSAGSASGGSGGSMPCQMANYTFEPKIPTVFLLVDRSGSMFDCRTNGGPTAPSGIECADMADTSWYPLRDGVLTVVQALETEVRFGFAAFTGEVNDAMCPDMMPVAPAFNNYAAIAEQYSTLAPPPKGETPTRKALDGVGALLTADTAPGDKFILFVTDGQPDYCDDSNQLCAPDSGVGGLQTLAAAGIKTLVFGLSAPGSTPQQTAAFESVLSAFANAGDGQPVVMPGTTDPFAFYDQCNGVAGWLADFTATGKPAERGQTIGTYAEVAGTATVYRPDVTNQDALVDLFSAALSGVKSCTFDLSNVNGQSIKVDLNKLGEASVSIEGTEIPQDATNGWTMASQTQLVLNGTACESWRMPDNNDIAFNFPCNTIIFE